ncbi:hypothetical protein HS088_TW13G00985 [Tripterygium wilfordii]|uniref:DUF4378 domain-containing protein n=1 Tax=Tripterygium wilfordii TaxID=458696 RepID=A0A7J7CVG1_TRIWF|nr:uncharacterized protein LOC120013013 [Tripterygium wilfordii]XP_038720537.1 uncharacterized protein LOC120013013 [Tripterygium wilfordii]KAF5738090.1 hypothetical protein HS088_TW13G00985 [Tripterygium wilfordii]
MYYQIEEDWSEHHCYPVKDSMKKLINEEISKQPYSRKSAPNIVARLMGMDMLPLDTNSEVQPIDRKNENGVKFSKKRRNERGSATHFSYNSNSSRQEHLDLVDHYSEGESERWDYGRKSGKLRPREHPQEEELQKFKKEFEAWQAARFRECSKPFELGILGNVNRQLSQDNLSGGKMEPYTNKPGDHKGLKLKAKLQERDGLWHHKHKSEPYLSEQNGYFSSESRTMCEDFEPSSPITFDQKSDKSYAPTKIVILKPGPDRICDPEESWTSSSGTVEEKGSMEDFLQEVKKRLKCELQGKVRKKSSVVRGSGIETPFSEKSSDPRKIARHIARQVRAIVTRDFGVNLLRSESTRSYKSEVQFNGPGSPEFINRDTRKFFSERLRNVLKREIHLEVPEAFSGSTRSSALANEKVGLKSKSTAKNEQSYWEIVNDKQDMQTRSFRHGDDEGALPRELSSRNLIRSLSAPVSGTSFGKLLLEDRHILTGAQIRRKHEVIENVSLDMRKRKKDRFNFKEKVTHFKYSFTLRGGLFGRKIQSMAESYGKEHDFAKDLSSGPTVMNFSERHENPTEVPPSPASVCSSAQEELWRPEDYLSPISTPDLMGEDSALPEVFKEISSNLNELRRQLKELGSDARENPDTMKEHIESEMVHVEDQAEAYIRDLLIASGFYYGSYDKSLCRWDPLSRLISTSVFEEVEESYRKSAKGDDSMILDQDVKKFDHKLLLDLLNEALSIVLGPPVAISRFRRKINDFSRLTAPHGRKLLDNVWEMIQDYLYPPTEKSYYSLDDMVTHDLGSAPWTDFTDEEVTTLGKEVECLVMADLIEETVNDFHL